MAMMHYLTVPDFMWINLQVNKKTEKWDYALLEEAVFLQYGHGKSADVMKQATQLLLKFPAMRPFKKGNEATAFIGFVGFLAMNGLELDVPDEDGYEWVKSVEADPSTAQAKIEEATKRDSHHGHGSPDSEAILEGVLARYSKTVAALMASGYKAVLA